MPLTLDTLKIKIMSVVQDHASLLSQITDGDIDEAIREALEAYDDDAPRLVVADTAGNGVLYDFDLPATYVDGYSRIVSVEYPIGSRPAEYVPSDQYGIYRTSTTTKLRFNYLTPANGTSYRMVFTGRHTIDDLDSATATTIPAIHTQAFVNLCGAKCLMRLAARYTQEKESTLNIDSVDRVGKSDATRRLADKLLASYREIVAVSRGESPASTVVNWDVGYAGGLVSPLTHRSRR